MNDQGPTNPGEQSSRRPELDLAKPRANLPSFSFSETSPTAMRRWVEALPLVNTNETAAQLSLATTELAVLDIDASDKFEIAEALRPVVHYVANRLDRLNMNRVKADDDELAYHLLNNLYTAYKSALLDSLAEQGEKTRGPLTIKARDSLVGLLHRCIADLSRLLTRNMQYYRSPPIDGWRQLNTIYRIAVSRDFQAVSYVDDENSAVEELSIRDCYLRALLVASAHPNQLAPQQINLLFNALDHWVSAASLDPDFSNALLAIDLGADHGPRHARFVKPSPHALAIRTEVLAYEIDAYLKGIDGTLAIPAAISPRFLAHLVNAWSSQRTRTHKRATTEIPLRVCIGLRSIHYFLAGGTEFQDQIANPDALLRREVNPFLELDYEASPTPAAQNQAQSNVYEHLEAQAFDVSPEGYRISWLDPLPDNAQVGELIALREEVDARWNIGVIRWIHQGDEVSSEHYIPGTSMGVQLLSPRAIPVAIRVIKKTGGPTAFARALLLPGLQSIKQPATIITPSVPFRVQEKVQVHRQGLQTTAALLEMPLNTECVNQFTYRMLDGYLESVRLHRNIDALSAMTEEDTTQGP